MSAVERAAEVLAEAIRRDNCHGLLRAAIAAASAAGAEALSAAGLLAEPTDRDQRETRTEWGVRRNHGTGALVDGPYSQRHAEVMAKAWDGTVVRRKVSTGPWVEVTS